VGLSSACLRHTNNDSSHSSVGTLIVCGCGYVCNQAFPDYTDMPVKMVQKITAARLTESKQTIPHYYLTVDVQMDQLMKVENMSFAFRLSHCILDD
jgi:pyruvate/2-oxoglutarate dehydrogenase complex dihydrolipoamide acyltransferase (E2) component